MKNKKILIFHSNNVDKFVHRRISRINEIAELLDCTIFHYFLEDLFQPDSMLFRNLLVERMKEKGLEQEEVEEKIIDWHEKYKKINDLIEKTKPDIIIIHCGMVFRNFFYTFSKVLRDIKKNNENIQITFEGINLWYDVGDNEKILKIIRNGIDEGYFDNSDELRQDIINLYGKRKENPFFNQDESRKIYNLLQTTLFLQDELIKKPQNETYIDLLQYCVEFLEEKIFAFRENLDNFEQLHDYKNNIKYLLLLFEDLQSNDYNLNSIQNDIEDTYKENKKILFSIRKHEFIQTDGERETFPDEKIEKIIAFYTKPTVRHLRAVQKFKKNKQFCHYLLTPCYADEIFKSNPSSDEIVIKLSKIFDDVKPDLFIIHAGSLVQQKIQISNDAVKKLKRKYPNITFGIDDATRLGFESSTEYFSNSHKMENLVEYLIKK